jgi:NAD(P)-dependent dehydrogenase (short-subunit alcohol dehydrogenase family)
VGEVGKLLEETSMGNKLQGKVALVTGGASGIGRATALTFANEGAIVIIADIDPCGSEKTAEKITATGGAAHAIATDVTEASDVEILVARIADAWGHLDCAFNNAGVPDGAASWLDLTEEVWERVLKLNLTGVWLCMRAEIRQMLIQGGGAIVNTASIFGLVASPTAPAYTASKHGVIGITKSAALAYAHAGIRVNAVCPAYIDTPMSERIFSQYPERKSPIIARHPIGRLGTPDEVAEAVVWLCTDASSFVTGHALAVDAGYVVQ